MSIANELDNHYITVNNYVKAYKCIASNGSYCFGIDFFMLNIQLVLQGSSDIKLNEVGIKSVNDI